MAWSLGDYPGLPANPGPPIATLPRQKDHGSSNHAPQRCASPPLRNRRNSKTAPLNGALCNLNFPVNMSHIKNGTDK